MNASDVSCPVCQVPPGAPCTQPTNAGRKAVGWFHHPRREKAAAGVIDALER